MSTRSDTDANVDPDVLVDRYIDLFLRGEAPPLERYAAEHAELTPAGRDKLAALIAALGPPSERRDDDLPYERLGSFRLIRRLGAGGMGLVFLAEHERLGRLVALKIMRPEAAASDIAVQRFERESRAIARLRHPNIVTVFDSGTDHGVPYLAMELIPGRGLDEIAASAPGGRVPTIDALRWTRDVARALACAHQAGVVHRDVKPSNVRITTDGRALLLDFGLASDASAHTLTASTQFQGTLSYVAPEQIRGLRSEIDERIDVYALGVTLYELVTGGVPFGAANPQAALHLILTCEPRTPRELVPGLSRELETVIQTAMEKDRARRYASAQALADELDALLEMRPISARPSSRMTRVWKWSRRNPSRAAAIASVGLLLVGGPTVLALVQTRHARVLAREKAAVEDQRRVADERASELDRVARFQAAIFNRLDSGRMGQGLVTHLRSSARDSLRARGALANEIERRIDELDASITAASAASAAAALFEAEVLAPARRELLSEFDDVPSVRARLLLENASLCSRLGLYAPAIEAQTQAVADLSRLLESAAGEAIAQAAIDLAEARADLGDFARVSGNLDLAEEHLRGAHELLAAHGAAECRAALALTPRLADVVRHRGRLAEAEALYRDALQRAQLAFGAHDAVTLSAAHGVAVILDETERSREASALLEPLLPTFEALHGPDAWQTLDARAALGAMFANAGDLPRAEAHLREAYELVRAAHSDDSFVAINSSISLASVLLQRSSFEEASALLEAAVERSTRVLGPHHEQSVYARVTQANLAGRRGRLSEAEDAFWKLFEEGLGVSADSSTLATHASNRAMLRQQHGTRDDALAAYAEAIDRARAVRPDDLALPALLRARRAGFMAEVGCAQDAELDLRELCVELTELGPEWGWLREQVDAVLAAVLRY